MTRGPYDAVTLGRRRESAFDARRANTNRSAFTPAVERLAVARRCSTRCVALAMLCVVAGSTAPSRAGAQTVRGEIIGALVEHRLTLGQEPEREFGAAFGVAMWAPVMSWMELRGQLIGGALAAQTPQTDDRRFGELDLSALIVPFSWLAFEVGGTSRTYTAPLGRQRWITMRAGAELRLELLEDRVRGTLGGALMPVASASGVENPSVAVSAGSTLTYTHGHLSATVAYEIDRYDFPATGGARRLEQLSSLAARIGLAVPELPWPLGGGSDPD